MTSQQHRYSAYSLLLCYALILVTGIFYYPKWKQQGTEATISWDVSGYYMYLPALFIYKDIRQCRFGDSIIQKYQPTHDFHQAYRHPSGNYVMKYAAGQALLLSPFFFTAHAIARSSAAYEADGFTYPYQVAIGLAALLYALLGLWVLRKVLLRYFPDATTAVTLFVIVFGTNYLDYAAVNGAMTHNTVFTVYALLLWATVRFYEKPSAARSLVVGALVGLATLIRPTEIISALIPLLWHVGSVRDARQRVLFFSRDLKYTVLMGGAAIVVAGIQLLYWKLVAGEWIVYSYQQEGFDWLHPHIKNGLISFRSGWLTYSPVMVLSLAGFVWLYRRKELFVPTLVFSIIFMYLCFAWQTWWYGGSLGQRAMVQAYPVLAFPLAAALQSLLRRSVVVRWITILFLAFCVAYNMWLTHQAHRGGLFRAGEMTGPYLRAIFGRFDVDKRVFTMLDNNVLYESIPPDAISVYTNNFENDTAANIVAGLNGKCLFMDRDVTFSNEYMFAAPGRDVHRIRATADFLAPELETGTWHMTQFVLRFYRKNEMIGAHAIRVQRVLEQGQVQAISVDGRIPPGADRISILFWNPGSDKKLYVDNLEVRVFR
ncbi:MAG TPA: hypothetical protein VFZ78_03640 [Flavisolibacter sp.]